ncbi:MAG: hypothetical protein IPG66_04860 [Hydrogenophilales bacterium]|nr:hypothetical protein [Hydrogenophilales bacterium]
MANAIKNVAKYIKNNPDTEESIILSEFCAALEAETTFDLHRIFGMKSKAFELALEVMADWRFDRHVAERRLQKFLQSSDD